MGNNPAGAGSKQYEDIEPFCHWHKEEGHDILYVHLQDFKKKQMNVEFDNGILVIWGERPVDPQKWQRFRKEIRLPRGWKKEEIHAELSTSGVLSIIIPKRQTMGKVIRKSFSRVNSKLMNSFPSWLVSDTAKVGWVVLVLGLMVAYVTLKYRHPYEGDN